jgi:hypothetical protein
VGETLEYRVDVFCKNEGTDVASVKTPGPLDAKTIRSGAFAIDGARFPVAKLADSLHARCGKCGGFLFFRLAGGKVLDAIPGMFEVKG